MRSKPSNDFESNRPESGGADHDEQREKPELLDRDKQEFAAAQKAKGELPPREAVEQPAERAGEGEKEGEEERRQ